MPAVITHKAIMMLSRDRLREVRRRVKVVRDRKLMFGTPRSDLEDKVFRLTDLAIAAMEEPSGADDLIRTFDGTVPGGVNPVSRFAVMGSMGPDIPGFSELFNPGQQWVFDTIHKGTPDYNRELVNAGTTDLPLTLYAEAVRLGQAGIADATERAAELAKVRAYVMGHLCHVAGDIVSHPFINDLEWHEGSEAAPHREHGANEVALDCAVAQTLFGTGGIRTGAEGWQRWWPGEKDLHPSFFDAYAAAFRATYGAAPRPGSADWNTFLERQGPPDVDGGFFRHGYKTLRSFGIGVGYDWGAGHWFGLLTPLFAPLIMLPVVSWAMPHARHFYETPQAEDLPSAERTAFELLFTPLGMASPGALWLGSVLLPYSARGTGGRSVTGVVMQGLSLGTFVTSAIESASVDTPEDGIPGWARWIFFLLPQLVNGGVFTGLTIADGDAESAHPRPVAEKPNKNRLLVDLVNLLPLLVLGLFGIFLLILWLIKAAAGGDKSAIRPSSAAFITTTVIWMIAMVLLWALIPFRLAGQKVPDIAPPDDPAFQPHALRMFDDNTLWLDPAQGDARLARVYPSDLRPLARLWWSGDGAMDIRVDRLSLTFRPEGGDEQVIPAPIAPMTTAEFIVLLQDLVRAQDGTTGGLNGALFDAADAGSVYPLPSGATFATHGEAVREHEQFDAARLAAGLSEFRRLGTADEDGAYTLYHAPKPAQSVHLGPNGTFRAGSDADLRTLEAVNGYSYVTDPALDGPRPDKLMSRAAELGALLCMGAAGHVGAGATESDKVYQVFRNWSLDRRRVNEWRLLITGGAFSDKEGALDRYDGAMPFGAGAPADTATWRASVAGASDSVIAEAEGTARELGWINVLEDWLVALESGVDMSTADVADPTARTPRSLSRALAFILDAPDPAGGAV